MNDNEFTIPFPCSASTGDTHGFPLAPAWHDKPTCEGLWVWDGRVETVCIHNGRLCVPAMYSPHYATCNDLSGRWFGPIPEDKR